MAIAAVIFDLDGVLVDSEQVWDAAREAVTRECAGRWHDGAQRAMMGMSSLEWSRYMHDELGVELDPEAISKVVVKRVADSYRRHLPLLPGAVAAVERLAARWPLGLASSANRPVIELALELAGIERCFRVTVSSEEVARGKPAPDVYLEAASKLGIEPILCAAVEDSTNGLLSAAAAGMRVIAVPNRSFPPDGTAVDKAAVVVHSLDELTPERVAGFEHSRPSPTGE